MTSTGGRGRSWYAARAVPRNACRYPATWQSAASLNHPSIIAVYDTGEDAGGEVRVPCIVMEDVDGRTLGDLLGDGRRLRPERAARGSPGGVLRALDHSHRNGIV